jgi:hypothetical protein
MPWHRTLDAQGIYYLLTGVWPLLWYRSFEAVLGEKIDDWLVRLIALLAITIGAALLLRQPRTAPTPHTAVLAAGSAVAFGAIDVIYALSRVISPLYLLDAVVELAFIIGVAQWVASHRRRAAASPAERAHADPATRLW